MQHLNLLSLLISSLHELNVQGRRWHSNCDEITSSTDILDELCLVVFSRRVCIRNYYDLNGHFLNREISFKLRKF
jgi:hypothetical protein